MSGSLLLTVLVLILLSCLALVGRHALMILPFVAVTMYWLWARGGVDESED
jgi:hypothetical protein